MVTAGLINLDSTFCHLRSFISPFTFWSCSTLNRMCFGSKKRESLDYPPSRLVDSQPSDRVEDLSDAFQKLSIKSEPIASVQGISTTSKPLVSAQSTKTTWNVRPNPVPRIPTFPLNAVRCRRCGWVPKYRDKVKPSNPNGNAGRPYYICFMCKKNETPAILKSNRMVHKKGWITWDDSIGISQENHFCFCNEVSRQDRAGVDSYCPGSGFWTCATGSCNYLSFRRDGLPIDEAYERGAGADGFKPWLLPCLPRGVEEHFSSRGM